MAQWTESKYKLPQNEIFLAIETHANFALLLLYEDTFKGCT